MWFMLMMLAFALALVAVILGMLGNTKGALGFLFAGAAILVAFLMDVALRAG